MSVFRPAVLEAALANLGKAYVVAGGVRSAGAAAILGATEGDVVPNFNPTYNERKYPESTGDAVRGVPQVLGYNPQITIPLLWGDPATYARVNPLGRTGGGNATAPQDVVLTTLILIPEAEFTNGWGYNGVTWITGTGNPPVHTIWIPSGYFTLPSISLGRSEGSKRVASVTFQGVMDETWPVNYQSWLIGDPVAKGFTALRI